MGRYNHLPLARDDNNIHDLAAAWKEPWLCEGSSWAIDGCVEEATTTIVGCAATMCFGELREGQKMEWVVAAT